MTLLYVEVGHQQTLREGESIVAGMFMAALNRKICQYGAYVEGEIKHQRKVVM